jgi:hypothetical protein
MHISFDMLPLLPAASAAQQTGEADQNGITPVPGEPERIRFEGGCAQGILCVSVAADSAKNPGGASRKGSIVVRRPSTRTDSVTTSALKEGGAVPHRYALIPNPARPGDPPNRLKVVKTKLLFSAPQPCGRPKSYTRRRDMTSQRPENLLRRAVLSSRIGSSGHSSPCPDPET